jgi:hypothetical protein
MKLEWYSLTAETYFIPTIIGTYDEWLNGHKEIQLRWLNWGVSLMFEYKL